MALVLPHEEVEAMWFGGLDIQPGKAPSMEAMMKRWFHIDSTFDSTCRNYKVLIQQLLEMPFEEVVVLGDTPDHSLTLILLLDQFTRNFSRGTAFPFTQTDPLAQRLAKHFCLTLSHDTAHPPYKKIWYYLPFGHSENISYQELSISKTAFTAWECRSGEWKEFHLMMKRGMESAWKHYVIIERFGRFPHRNEVMGRETTEEEKKFLDEGGNTFAPPKPQGS